MIKVHCRFAGKEKPLLCRRYKDKKRADLFIEQYSRKPEFTIDRVEEQ